MSAPPARDFDALAARVIELEGAINGYFDAQMLHEHLRTDEDWDAAEHAERVAWERLHEVMEGRAPAAGGGGAG